MAGGSCCTALPWAREASPPCAWQAAVSMTKAARPMIFRRKSIIWNTLALKI
jgi:hypothetical protein